MVGGYKCVNKLTESQPKQAHYTTRPPTLSPPSKPSSPVLYHATDLVPHLTFASPLPGTEC